MMDEHDAVSPTVAIRDATRGASEIGRTRASFAPRGQRMIPAGPSSAVMALAALLATAYAKAGT